MVVLICTALLFSACSGGGGNEAQNVAKQFLQTFYTVDAGTAQNYALMIKLESDSVNIQKNMTTIQAITSQYIKRFQPYAQETYLSAMKQNQQGKALLECSDQHKCTLQPGTITLTPDQKQDDYRDYRFTAETRIIFNDKSKKSETEVEKGLVCVSKAGGVWKVSDLSISSSSWISGHR